eukprot:4212006-Prymnesium_polylepis.1
MARRRTAGASRITSASASATRERSPRPASHVPTARSHPPDHDPAPPLPPRCGPHLRGSRGAGAQLGQADQPPAVELDVGAGAIHQPALGAAASGRRLRHLGARPRPEHPVRGGLPAAGRAPAQPARARWAPQSALHSTARRWDANVALLLLLTCAQSIAISYFGWRCRSMVSATGYTVIGVANKMLTVLGSVLLTDQRSSPVGIACLLGCLLAASLYRQAPLRAEFVVKRE